MARRFEFPLAALLRLREQAEEGRKKEYAAAVGAAEEERGRRLRLAGELRECQERIVALYAAREPFAQVADAYREAAWLSGGMTRSEAVQPALDRAAEEARQRLVAARRDRRALEILRDRRREAHGREAERLGQAGLDELAVQARVRERRAAAARGPG